jgi:transcriptional regulator with PAS, ATPase and Fis domain
VLVFWEGGLRRYLLRDGATMRVGRADTCTIQVPHASVSRTHLEIVDGPTLQVRDAGSSNGVYLNGIRVAPGTAVPLSLGAVVEFGKAALVVQELAQRGPGSRNEETRAQSRARVASDAATGLQGMQRVEQLVRLVAPSTLNVLILGETGVGKEVVAESIHRRSSRANHACIKLNCAALSESLLDAELFGFERGAFTGATASKPGLIEAAHEGTLFLDEVGDMPLATQAKLLRVLEQRSVRRVGAVKDIPVDTRIIAATNRNLVEMIEAGTFRQDIFFRLNGITIDIPPLRDRIEEVEGLALGFLRESAPSGSLSQDARAALRAHTWPGNVRELRSVIARAVVLSEGRVIQPEHLGLGSLGPTSRTETARAAKTAPGTLTEQIAALERTTIVDALTKTGGNQTQAAALLGISRRALLIKLDHFALPRPRRDKHRMKPGMSIDTPASTWEQDEDDDP